MDYTIFREHLKQLIQSRGKTVKDFAYEVDITPATISRYLTGDRTPELQYVVKLAEYFGVSVDWMLGINGDKFEVIPPALQEIMTLYSRATLSDKKVVQTLLEKYRLPNEK